MNASGGTFYVGRVDVAAGHDDHVLDTAADDDAVGLGQVAQIAGVIPVLIVLSSDETGHRFIAQRHWFATDLEDADAPGGQDAAVFVDDARLQPFQQTAKRCQSAGSAFGRRNRSV